MRDRRYLRTLIGANRINLHHEWHVVIDLKPIWNGFAQYRRSERPKRFSSLDFAVENVLHIRSPRIAQDRTVAESAWPPFHAPLQPSYDLSLRDGRGDLIAKHL